MDSKPKSNGNGIVILLLIVFFPAGLYLMWTKTNWNKSIKIIVSAVVGLILFIAVFTPKDTAIPVNANTDALTEPDTTAELETTSKIETTSILETTIAPETTSTPETTVPPETTATPDTTKAPETTKAPDTTTHKPVVITYVLNTSTKKIHYQSCRYVKDIAPENYSTTTDFAAVIAQDYKICSVCNPKG